MKTILFCLFLFLSNQFYGQVKATTTKQQILVKPNTNIQKMPAPKPAPAIDSGAAVFVRAYVTIVTGHDNKDHDTHYSFGLFNQGGQQPAVFHDDNDNDEYAANSTKELEMNSTGIMPPYSSFYNGGHIHINIAPKGNDGWDIYSFKLSMVFSISSRNNQTFTKTVTWLPSPQSILFPAAFSLWEDNRNADLMFYYNNTGFIPGAINH